MRMMTKLSSMLAVVVLLAQGATCFAGLNLGGYTFSYHNWLAGFQGEEYDSLPVALSYFMTPLAIGGADRILNAFANRSAQVSKLVYGSHSPVLDPTGLPQNYTNMGYLMCGITTVGLGGALMLLSGLRLKKISS